MLTAMPLADAFSLFRHLGVNVECMSKKEFTASYFLLAKRYHPDRNPGSAGLMANINAARATILNSYRSAHGIELRWCGHDPELCLQLASTATISIVSL